MRMSSKRKHVGGHRGGAKRRRIQTEPNKGARGGLPTEFDAAHFIDVLTRVLRTHEEPGSVLVTLHTLYGRHVRATKRPDEAGQNSVWQHFLLLLEDLCDPKKPGSWADTWGDVITGKDNTVDMSALGWNLLRLLLIVNTTLTCQSMVGQAPLEKTDAATRRGAHPGHVYKMFQLLPGCLTSVRSVMAAYCTLAGAAGLEADGTPTVLYRINSTGDGYVVPPTETGSRGEVYPARGHHFSDRLKAGAAVVCVAGVPVDAAVLPATGAPAMVMITGARRKGKAGHNESPVATAMRDAIRIKSIPRQFKGLGRARQPPGYRRRGIDVTPELLQQLVTEAEPAAQHDLNARKMVGPINL